MELDVFSWENPRCIDKPTCVGTATTTATSLNEVREFTFTVSCETVKFSDSTQHTSALTVMPKKSLPINELYTCLQGEGKLTGVPSILIRFVGCRLRCAFANSICDTWHNSWSPEKGGISIGDIVDVIKNNPQIKHAIITGGGPTLHKRELPLVTSTCQYYGLHVTLETEGSEYVEGVIPDLLSLSPKLKSSTPIADKVYDQLGRSASAQEIARHEHYRTRYDAMKRWMEIARDYQIKPVICDRTFDEDVQELNNILDTLSDGDANLRQQFVKNCWLMPEGMTDEILKTTRMNLAALCIKYGYNYTDRLHITIYGPKRYV